MRLFDYFRKKTPPGRYRRGFREGALWQQLSLTVLEERTLPSYTITDLGTFGGTISDAYGIYRQGQVVGGAEPACNCTAHAFLWADNVLHDLGAQGLSGSNYAEGINDLGQVVGNGDHPFLWSKETGFIGLGFNGDARKINNRSEIVGALFSPPHAVLWRDGTAFDLGTLYGGVSLATGINTQGDVVGQAGGRAFLWTEATGMHDLGTLDGPLGATSGASAINYLGQIVGSSYSIAVGTSHPTYFTRTGAVDLGSLGGEGGAEAINNLGQVVGDSGGRAFVTDVSGGPMLDLNTLIPPDSGWSRLFTAEGINDAGQIIGSGQLPGNNNVHAYLLTPDQPAIVAPVAPVPGEGELIAPATTVRAVPGRSGEVLPLLDEMTSEGSECPRRTASLGPVGRLPAPAAVPSQSLVWADPLGDKLTPLVSGCCVQNPPWEARSRFGG